MKSLQLALALGCLIVAATAARTAPKLSEFLRPAADGEEEGEGLGVGENAAGRMQIAQREGDRSLAVVA